MFIVLGSPVTEVGRDHGTTGPWSSRPPCVRSSSWLAACAAATAGRLRNQHCLTGYQLRHLNRPSGAAFRWPGFEDGETFLLASHRLGELLHPHEIDGLKTIDARPRIRSPTPEPLQPQLPTGWTWSTPACARPCCAQRHQWQPIPHHRAPVRWRAPAGRAAPRSAAPPQWRTCRTLLAMCCRSAQRFRQQTQNRWMLMLPPAAASWHGTAWRWNGETLALARCNANVTRRRMRLLLDGQLMQGGGIAVWGDVRLRAVRERFGWPQNPLVAMRSGTAVWPCP